MIEKYLNNKIRFFIIYFVMICLGFGLLNLKRDIYKPQAPVNYKYFQPEQLMNSVVHILAEVEYYTYHSHSYRHYNSWQGSGCLIKEDLILTAAHVVNGANKFTITFSDGSVYVSSDFWYSEVTDVGFIRIEPTDKKVLSFGDSDKLKLSDDVWIFGSPFGVDFDYQFSVTRGIVSGLDREYDSFFGEKNCHWVDAASWPGNSGGPVVNKHGEIIGILVGGISYNECLSVIIPSNVAKQCLSIYEEECKLERIN